MSIDLQWIHYRFTTLTHRLCSSSPVSANDVSCCQGRRILGLLSSPEPSDGACLRPAGRGS